MLDSSANVRNPRLVVRRRVVRELMSRLCNSFQAYGRLLSPQKVSYLETK